MVVMTSGQFINKVLIYLAPILIRTCDVSGTERSITIIMKLRLCH